MTVARNRQDVKKMRVAPDLKNRRVETHHCGGSAQINDKTATAGNNKLAFPCARGPAIYRCDRVFATTLIISTPDSSGGNTPIEGFSRIALATVLRMPKLAFRGRVWLQAILIRGLYLSDQQRGAPFGAKRMVGGNK